MMALRAHRRGGPDVLVYESAPMPPRDAGNVLVEVHAAGVTFAELSWDETWTRDGQDRTPIIPTHEFSGVVVDVAGDVSSFQSGDEVFGVIPFDRDDTYPLDRGQEVFVAAAAGTEPSARP
jgi:NADPH:quinone reductase-like Zn-dependent oxidoreductase